MKNYYALFLLRLGIDIWNEYRPFNVNFSNLNFDGRNFAGYHFDRVNFTNASFKKADLAGASFIEAILERASLHQANFDGATLTKANLIKAILYASSFCGAKLQGANMSISQADNTTFNFSDLTNADFEGASLISTTFGNAILQGALLKEADLRRAKGNNQEIRDLRICGIEITYTTEEVFTTNNFGKWAFPIDKFFASGPSFFDRELGREYLEDIYQLMRKYPATPCNHKPKAELIVSESSFANLVTRSR